MKAAPILRPSLLCPDLLEIILLVGSAGLTTVACPKRQTSVLNGKSPFLSCFPTKLDDIWSDDGPWEDLYARPILSSLVG